MKVLHEKCAGLDVHKDSVVACVRIAGSEDDVRQEVQQFGTTMKELLRLSEWLAEHGCTIAAMEATGVYWRPVWHVLEDAVELMLVNARDFRNVPGRKTDVNDAVWLADLLAHGLLRASFVPPEAQQDVRYLTRTRRQLSRERGHHVLRIQKVLEDANVKLSSVLTNVMGKTGRRVLEGLVAGETDPTALIKRKDPRVKASESELHEAVRGHVTERHRFEIQLRLDLFDALGKAIDRVDVQLQGALEPFRNAANLLITIPGVGQTVAESIVGEVGIDMTRFPSAGHLRSWACLCPRSDMSAGKHRSTRTRRAGPWLKPVLVQAAWGASRVKGSYLRAQFLRLKARRGAKKAIVAVAASILTISYHLMRTGCAYKDLGGDYFDRIDKDRAARRHVQRLKELGFVVQIEPAAA